MVGRYLVADLDRGYTLQIGGKRRAFGNLRDVGSADDLRAFDALAGGFAVEEHLVIDREFLRRGDGGCSGAGGEFAGQGGSGGGLRAYEVDFRRLRAAAAFEVAVVGAQRDGVRRGAHVRADAETAGVFEDAAACGDERCERTVFGEHVHDLPRAAGDAHFHVFGDVLALEDLGDGADVAVGGVGARADHDLVDPGAAHRLDGDDT